MKILPVLLMLVLAAPGDAAETRAPRDAVMVDLRNLSRLIETDMEREGKLPPSLADLEYGYPHVMRDCPMILGTGRLVWFDSPVELTGRQAAEQILLMTRDSYRPRRWRESWISREGTAYLGDPVYGIIVLTPGGRVVPRELPPEVMRAALRARGRHLPEPGGSGPFPYEMEYHNMDTLMWLAAALTGICLVVWLALRRDTPSH
ncbi:MAG: hypothetical protein EOP88_11180 [Verrucomicrobiaceae bacterium]|nr:MAG: hypothetical protein EOP88_11180 [Verrucomicrobiaceae bacterium]